MTQIKSDGITYTRNLILRGMSIIYLIAFLSFYYQSPGLFGNNGILPSRLQIESSYQKLWSRILRKPTLLHFASFFGLDAEYMTDVLALLGSLISFAGFASQKVCIVPTFTILWCLYYSLIQIVQTFANQSDYLLLEAGFIMIMLAPLTSPNQSNSSDKIMFILLKWLLARFLFASSMVKLVSRSLSWWNFTAFNHYFQATPLPTPLAWQLHNLPTDWLKVMNIFVSITELGCVWLFFFPHRAVRRYMFYWQIFLQLNMILSGNHGLLHFMLPILLLTLLDDHFFADQSFKRITLLGVKVLVIGYLLFFGACFALSSPLSGLKFEEHHLDLLCKTIRPAPLIAAFVIISTFLTNLVSHPTIIHARTFLQKIYGVNVLISFSMIALSMVIVSLVPHGNLDRTTNLTNTDLGSFYQHARRFHIVNDYGQHLRKMPSERHEIIYEYAEDIDGPWNAYDFSYKPSSVNSSLQYIGPYFPRLDHKLQVASSATYRQELWTISLAYRLLQGEPNILTLLGKKSSVPPPPKYVRASLYNFLFTKELDSTKRYWRRQKLIDFFPAFTVENDTLWSYLKSIKISPNYREIEVKNKMLKRILDFLRKQTHLLEGHLLIFGVLVTGLIIIITKHFV